MQTTTSSDIKTNSLIGQRYQLISSPAQTDSLQTLVFNISNIEIKFVEPLYTSKSLNKLNSNTILLIRCLTLISILFANSPEGLQEASEALEDMVEYYKENRSYSQQVSLPKDLGVINATVLPSVVRQPLVLDFE